MSNLYFGFFLYELRELGVRNSSYMSSRQGTKEKEKVEKLKKALY